MSKTEKKINNLFYTQSIELASFVTKKLKKLADMKRIMHNNIFYKHVKFGLLIIFVYVFQNELAGVICCSVMLPKMRLCYDKQILLKNENC